MSSPEESESIVPPPSEEREDELAIFKRRAQWWYGLHTDQFGGLPPQGRLQAIDQAEKLGRTRLRELDPGGPVPKDGFELVGGEKLRVHLHRAENPRPKSSFGFAAQPVEVRAEGDLHGTTLKMALDQELARGLDPASVRLFRFDTSVQAWYIVALSGASLNGTYVWAKLHRPGLYVPIGLPQDAWLLRTIMLIHSYTPWLLAAREMNALEQLLDPICKLILCGGVFEQVRGEPTLADTFGLPPFEGGSGLGSICDHCFGLDLPKGGLPEVSIFKEVPKIPDYLPPASYKALPTFFCNSWVSCGPNNFSGRIKSLVIHPTNGNIVYAGAADGGVWKSIDGGTTWYATMQLELSLAIGGLGICARSPNVLYAATGEDIGSWGFLGVGVYKTRNGGGDWDLMGHINSVQCTRVLVHPTDPNIVYIAGDAGLHKSIDGGASWNNVRTDHVSDALMDPFSPDTIYAGVWGVGVFKSNDGGTIWTLLTNGLPSGPAADWIKLAMGRNGTNGTEFLVAKMGTHSGLLYTSLDAGGSWTQLPGIHQAAPYNEWTNMVAVDPNNHDVLFAGGVDLERSSNGGATFVSIGGTHKDHHALVFFNVPSPRGSSLCYMATDGGVYKSLDNGVTWKLTSQGLVATQLYSLGVAQTSPFVMGAATQDQGIIKSGGLTDWADTSAGPEGGFFIVDPNKSNNIYTSPWNTTSIGSSADSYLFRSTNGGTMWTNIRADILKILGTPTVVVEHLAVKPGDSNQLLCSASDKVFRSVNQGTTWEIGLDADGSVTQRVAFSPSNPAICYATTIPGEVFHSTGSGALGTWSQPSTPAGVLRISAIAVGWNDPNLVYIAYGGWGNVPHVYRSTDMGVTWANASGVPLAFGRLTDGLPFTPVNAVVIDPYNEEVVYVATDIGVFRTRDGGDSWEPFDDGMPHILTSELVLQKSTYTLYASTMGRGAYRRAL